LEIFLRLKKFGRVKGNYQLEAKLLVVKSIVSFGLSNVADLYRE
jgi:hypothetical protein